MYLNLHTLIYEFLPSTFSFGLSNRNMTCNTGLHFNHTHTHGEHRTVDGIEQSHVRGRRTGVQTSANIFWEQEFILDITL